MSGIGTSKPTHHQRPDAEDGKGDTVADAAAEIIRLHGEIEAAYQTSLDRAIRIGELLAQQKEALEHGQFLPWVAEHLPFSERTAQNYMRVFSRRAELKSATVADLTKAYRLLAPPKAEPQAEPDEETTKSAPVADLTPSANTQDASPATLDNEPESTTQVDAESSPTTKPSTPNGSTLPPVAMIPTSPPALAPASAQPAAQEPTSPQRPTPITSKDAFRVLLANVSRGGPDLARKVIEKFAETAALEVWIPSTDPLEDLWALDHLMAGRLEALAEKEYDGASSWVEGHEERINDVINQAAPQPSDDDVTDEVGEEA